MSERLISAAYSNRLPDTNEGEIPDEIVYLPEGEHDLTPTVNGKAQKIRISVPAARGQEIAASLQKDLEARQAQTVRPWFDFEHKAGKASAIPQSFRYEPGVGIMAKIEWTHSGKQAVQGKDFSYFSPTFYVDENNVPSSLPAKGPLGALVNEPAFRKMQSIAAADADELSPQPPLNTMSKLILAALAINPADEGAEAAAVKKIEAMASDLAKANKSNEDLTKENDKLSKKVEAAHKERTDSLIEAAVADGRIGSEDTETQDTYRKEILAGNAFAEAQLAKLPKQNADLGKSIVKAGADKSAKGAQPLEAKAKALVEAGEAKTQDEAMALVAAADPEAYNAYLATLG